ncbi:hypothetical protein ASZ78_006912 [Callipepla squamata]|uniref:Uncharacterized protein n=1 Tax=Callipepla squamata TaxID=9009 RepID=A0A226MN91_CALSU|nr:hypothetical protein ASZ78_006912 [Callipepla squamata]
MPESKKKKLDDAKNEAKEEEESQQMMEAAAANSVQLNLGKTSYVDVPKQNSRDSAASSLAAASANQLIKPDLAINQNFFAFKCNN